MNWGIVKIKNTANSHQREIKKTDGVSHHNPYYVRSILDVVRPHTKLGEWTDAQLLQEDILKRVEGTHMHSGGVKSIKNSLASIYSNQGRWKEAEELGAQVMEMSNRALGGGHPDTLTNMANLASTFWNQGRWKEAEELFVQVVGAEKRVLGQEHPSTLTSMGNLASIYQNQAGGDGRRLKSLKAVCAGHGHEEEGARPRASLYLDKHGQSRIDIPEPGAVEGGRRAGGAGHRDEE